MLKRMILTSFLICNIAQANCPQNVQKLSKGEAAPCSGWLVSEPKMQDFARNDEELEKAKKLIQAQEHLQKLSEAEVDFYKQKSTKAYKELERAEERRFWVGVGSFVLGTVLTGIAAKAAIESTR